MNHLKLFESFSEIDSLCKKAGIENYTINSDGSVDVNGDVDLFYQKMLYKTRFSNIKIGDISKIKFNRVIGRFSYSDTVTTLVNSPRHISGDFSCSDNRLTTLLGGPEYVGGDYYCNNNKLRDVYGLPENFRNRLYISKNPICELLSILDVIPGEQRSKIFVKFIKLLNEFKVIRQTTKNLFNKKTIVIKDRLEEALYYISNDIDPFYGKILLKPIAKTKFKYYKLT